MYIVRKYKDIKKKTKKKEGGEVFPPVSSYRSIKDRRGICNWHGATGRKISLSTLNKKSCTEQYPEDFHLKKS